MELDRQQIVRACVYFAAVVLFMPMLVILFGFVFVVLSMPAVFEPWSWRRARFEEAAEKGMVVVDAIERSTTDIGVPPARLDNLVPEYLPEIPKTALSRYPDYEYFVSTMPAPTRAWYDLGSRDGNPMAGPPLFPEGETGNAVLVFALDADGQFLDYALDRMPEEVEDIAFDPEMWRRRESRMAMVHSFLEENLREKTTFDEMTALLGEPDGSATPKNYILKLEENSPWELRIRCPLGGINWDVFFYWPSEDYPDEIYGGVVERIGDWAYVHE